MTVRTRCFAALSAGATEPARGQLFLSRTIINIRAMFAHRVSQRATSAIISMRDYPFELEKPPSSYAVASLEPLCCPLTLRDTHGR